jgi:hypothetical protein
MNYFQQQQQNDKDSLTSNIKRRTDLRDFNIFKFILLPA